MIPTSMEIPLTAENQNTIFFNSKTKLHPNIFFSYFYEINISKRVSIN